MIGGDCCELPCTNDALSAEYPAAEAQGIRVRGCPCICRCCSVCTISHIRCDSTSPVQLVDARATALLVVLSVFRVVCVWHVHVFLTCWSRFAQEMNADQKKALDELLAALPCGPNDCHVYLPKEPVGTLPDSVPQLNQLLAPFGLQAVDVAADGNCMFRALGHALGVNHTEVRQRVVEWLSNSRDLLCEFVHGRTFEEYLNAMSQPSEWGDHLCLVAAASVYVARIVVISSTGQTDRMQEVLPPRTKIQREIYIGHIAELHYVAIEPLNGMVWLK